METVRSQSTEAENFHSPLSNPIESTPKVDSIRENIRLQKIAAWKPGQTPPEGTEIVEDNILVDTTTQPADAVKTERVILPRSIIDNEMITTVPDDIGLDALQPYIQFIHGGPNPSLEPTRRDSTRTLEVMPEQRRGILSRIKTSGEIFTQRITRNRQRGGLTPTSGD